MNIIFMGTPDFAVPTLQRIIDDGHTVTSVFTQPDKPVGRKQVLTPPPVKALALSRGIAVHQPDTLKGEEMAALIASQSPDVIVVVAYGKLLPQSVLDIPRLGCINVHGSLLPKYRGAAPIQWSVINGEKQTGVTTMYMARGLDTGDMILKSAVDIGENETSGQLHDRLSAVGAELLSQTIKLLEQGDAPREAQDDAQSCYAPMLDKTIAKVDFGKTSAQVHNHIRGMSPWPVAFTEVQGKILKLHSSVLAQGKGASGELLSEKQLIIACGSGAVEITEVQFDGSKRMTGEEFLRGHRLAKGTIIG